MKKSKTPSAQNPVSVSTEQEGVFINKSLSTLGRIFTMLADRSAKTK